MTKWLTKRGRNFCYISVTDDGVENKIDITQFSTLEQSILDNSLLGNITSGVAYYFDETNETLGEITWIYSSKGDSRGYIQKCFKPLNHLKNSASIPENKILHKVCSAIVDDYMENTTGSIVVDLQSFNEARLETEPIEDLLYLVLLNLPKDLRQSVVFANSKGLHIKIFGDSEKLTSFYTGNKYNAKSCNMLNLDCIAFDKKNKAEYQISYYVRYLFFGYRNGYTTIASPSTLLERTLHPCLPERALIICIKLMLKTSNSIFNRDLNIVSERIVKPTTQMCLNRVLDSKATATLGEEIDRYSKFMRQIKEASEGNMTLQNDLLTRLSFDNYFQSKIATLIKDPIRDNYLLIVKLKSFMKPETVATLTTIIIDAVNAYDNLGDINKYLEETIGIPYKDLGEELDVDQSCFTVSANEVEGIEKNVFKQLEKYAKTYPNEDVEMKLKETLRECEKQITNNGPHTLSLQDKLIEWCKHCNNKVALLDCISLVIPNVEETNRDKVIELYLNFTMPDLVFFEVSALEPLKKVVSTNKETTVLLGLFEGFYTSYRKTLEECVDKDSKGIEACLANLRGIIERDNRYYINFLNCLKCKNKPAYMKEVLVFLSRVILADPLLSCLTMYGYVCYNNKTEYTNTLRIANSWIGHLLRIPLIDSATTLRDIHLILGVKSLVNCKITPPTSSKRKFSKERSSNNPIKRVFTGFKNWIIEPVEDNEYEDDEIEEVEETPNNDEIVDNDEVIDDNDTDDTVEDNTDDTVEDNTDDTVEDSTDNTDDTVEDSTDNTDDTDEDNTDNTNEDAETEHITDSKGKTVPEYLLLMNEYFDDKYGSSADMQTFVKACKNDVRGQFMFKAKLLQADPTLKGIFKDYIKFCEDYMKKNILTITLGGDIWNP